MLATTLTAIAGVFGIGLIIGLVVLTTAEEALVAGVDVLPPPGGVMLAGAPGKQLTDDLFVVGRQLLVVVEDLVGVAGEDPAAGVQHHRR